jgi:hypothetical protein
VRAIAKKLERNEHEASTPGTRPFTVAAIVIGWLALGLALDDGGGVDRQRLIGVATWLLLIALVRREPRVTQVQVATLVVLATLLEYSASPLLGLYTYRLHNVPAFVPPGHGLVYLAAVLVGTSATVTRRPWIPLGVLTVATAWAVGGLALPVHPDTLGAVLFVSFAAFILRGRYPGVYASAFILTAALELYGTHLGTWRWAPHDPTGVLSAANPPSGIPGGYCWLDFWALALAPLAYALVVRVKVVLRFARAAPS